MDVSIGHRCKGSEPLTWQLQDAVYSCVNINTLIFEKYKIIVYGNYTIKKMVYGN